MEIFCVLIVYPLPTASLKREYRPSNLQTSNLGNLEEAFSQLRVIHSLEIDAKNIPPKRTLSRKNQSKG